MKKNHLLIASLASLAGIMSIGAVAFCFNHPTAQTLAADAGTTTATAITGLAFNRSHILFYLSSSDYTTGHDSGQDNMTANNSRIAEYNFLSNIKVYTSQTDFVSLSTVAASGSEQVYFFDLYVSGPTLAVPCADSYKTSITKIVIPSGTVFPTYEYALAGSTSTTLNGYQTAKDITYKCSGSAFSEAYSLTKVSDTTISSVQYNLDNHFFLFYPSTAGIYSIGQTSYSVDRLKALDCLDNITVTFGSSTGTIQSFCISNNAFPGDSYFDIWNRGNCFAFRTMWLASAPTDVKFAAGTQIPAYEATYIDLVGKYYNVTTSAHFVMNTSESDYTDITALDSWAAAFVTATNGNCHDATAWTTQGNAYAGLSDAQKTYFVANAQTVYPDAYARLAFAVGKRGMNNFTAISIPSGANYVPSIAEASNDWMLIAAVTGIVALSALGFVLLKRKEDR